MSWKIEKIFTDTGAELSTGALNTTLGTSIQSCYDGRFMWVTCTNGIAIYEFWGQSSGDEPTVDEVDDLLWTRYLETGPQRKLKLITFINITSGQIKRSTRYLSLCAAPGWTGGAGSTTVGAYTLTFTQSRSDLLVATEVSANSVGVACTPYWITKVGSKMVVSNGANFNRCWVFDIATQRPETSFALTPLEFDGTAITANSNLLGSNGRIWFVNTVFNDANPQRLYNYRLSDSTLGYTNLAVRPSTRRSWLADGFNGYLYVTDFNGVSISKYDYTGGYVSRIRTNAFPTKIWTDQNRQIFVNSYGGMLTLIDWDDDDVHNDYSCEYDENASVAGFATDPVDTGKVWFTQTADGKLTRYDLAMKQQYETGPETDVVTEWVNVEAGGTATVSRPVLDGQIVVAGVTSQWDGAMLHFTDAFGHPTGLADHGSTKAMATYTAPAEDWVIVKHEFAAPGYITTVPARTYTTGSGETRTQRPYLFICDGATVRVFAIDTFLVRDNYMEVNGQGAVVGGPLAYFDEGP